MSFFLLPYISNSIYSICHHHHHNQTKKREIKEKDSSFFSSSKVLRIYRQIHFKTGDERIKLFIRLIIRLLKWLTIKYYFSCLSSDEYFRWFKFKTIVILLFDQNGQSWNSLFSSPFSLCRSSKNKSTEERWTQTTEREREEREERKIIEWV